LILVSLVLGCSSTPKGIYEAYEGERLTSTSLSKIDITNARFGVIIDHKYYVDPKKYSKILLLPGQHHIEWKHEFFSTLIPRTDMLYGLLMKTDLILEAGHSYKLQADRATRRGDRMRIWIKDLVTGKIIARSEKQ